MVLAGAAGLWAGAVIFTPAEEVVPVTDYTTAVARAGAVGASVNLVATAHWTQSPAGTNSAQGTVTTVSHVPGEVATRARSSTPWTFGPWFSRAA